MNKIFTPTVAFFSIFAICVANLILLLVVVSSLQAVPVTEVSSVDVQVSPVPTATPSATVSPTFKKVVVPTATPTVAK